MRLLFLLSRSSRQPVSREGERVMVSDGGTVEGLILVMTRLVAVTGQIG
jgi:hypothetical protein